MADNSDILYPNSGAYI